MWPGLLADVSGLFAYLAGKPFDMFQVHLFRSYVETPDLVSRTIRLRFALKSVFACSLKHNHSYTGTCLGSSYLPSHDASHLRFDQRFQRSSDL